MPDQLCVQVEELHKAFGKQEVLKGINLDVPTGDVVCMMGPSGSGKSTLLRCINRLEAPDSGRVVFEGNLIGAEQHGSRLYELKEKDLARQRARIGMVFQHFELFPHMRALENVMEGPIRVLRERKNLVRDRAEQLLDRVGLSEKANQYPARLSGGEKQRVAIARALCMQPSVMLFDEPTSALDPELVEEVLVVMRELAHKGMTMIIATHEVSFARDVADTIVVLDGGSLIERGAPNQVLDSPEHERTKAFFSKVRK